MDKRKYDLGAKVYTTLTGEQLLTVSGTFWNGFTYMHSFEESHMSCGYEYIRLAGPFDEAESLARDKYNLYEEAHWTADVEAQGDQPRKKLMLCMNLETGNDILFILFDNGNFIPYYQ